MLIGRLHTAEDRKINKDCVTGLDYEELSKVFNEKNDLSNAYIPILQVGWALKALKR